MITPKVHPSRFKKEHPPLVVIGDVDLIWRNALERGEIVVALEDLFEFGLNNREVVFQLFGKRKVIGVKVLLIPQQAVLMERLF